MEIEITCPSKVFGYYNPITTIKVTTIKTRSKRGDSWHLFCGYVTYVIDFKFLSLWTDQSTNGQSLTGYKLALEYLFLLSVALDNRIDSLDQTPDRHIGHIGMDYGVKWSAIGYQINSLPMKFLLLSCLIIVKCSKSIQVILHWWCPYCWPLIASCTAAAAVDWEKNGHQFDRLAAAEINWNRRRVCNLEVRGQP